MVLPVKIFLCNTSILDTIAPRCPNIKKVRIQVANGMVFSNTVYCHLCCGKNHQIVDCLDVVWAANVMPYLYPNVVVVYAQYNHPTLFSCSRDWCT